MTQLANKSTPTPASSSVREKFITALETITGESIEQMRDEPLGERRERKEASAGRSWKVVSYWPFIGRGNVLGDRIISNEEVEKKLDEALS